MCNFLYYVAFIDEVKKKQIMMITVMIILTVMDMNSDCG